MLSVGVYPDVSLNDAREARDKIRRQLAKGKAPTSKRRNKKAAKANSFAAIAAEWFEDQREGWAAPTVKRNTFLLKCLTDRIGKKAMNNIDPLTMSATIKSINTKNGPETARRTLGMARKVFAYAIGQGKAKQHPAVGLEAPKRKKGHRASIIDGLKVKEQRAAVGNLLRKIDGYGGMKSTKALLKLLSICFTRQTELRLARWDEIDFEAREWEIPAKRMKGSSRKDPQPHLISLPDQAIEILEELRELHGGTGYVFPTIGGEVLSMNAGNNALWKLGFEKDQHCLHGFRAMARTMLDEQLGYRVDIIEHQLGHLVRDANGVAYNRTTFLEDRRDMLQGWTDFLDECKKGESNVTPIKAAS